MTVSFAHWNMSRSPVRISVVPPAAVSTAANECSRSSASRSGVRRHAPAERLVEARGALPLPLERVGHRRPVGVVGGIGLHAVLARLGAEAPDNRARVVLLHAPQDLVDRAEQRVDGMAVVVGDRVRQREEGAIEHGGAVDDKQGFGTRPQDMVRRMKTITGLEGLRQPRARRWAPRTGTRSPRPTSTRSPTSPATTSGSTSIPSARRTRRSAARSRTATTRCRWRRASPSR